MSAEITLGHVWAKTILPFYEENGYVLYSKLLIHSEDREAAFGNAAFVGESIPKYCLPWILFREFPAPSSNLCKDDLGKIAKVILDDTTSKSGAKYKNMAILMESLNQSRLGVLAEDLQKLLQDSVTYSLCRRTLNPKPSEKELQSFAENHQEQIKQQLSPKLDNLAKNMQEYFRDILEKYGFNLQQNGDI
jgi:hypothetical protein